MNPRSDLTHVHTEALLDELAQRLRILVRSATWHHSEWGHQRPVLLHLLQAAVCGLKLYRAWGIGDVVAMTALTAAVQEPPKPTGRERVQQQRALGSGR